ncbi:N-acetylmuramate alpha-1-phosphate uridylyltransferase MurU [Echinimonas agarilytica]|uniref:Nucleotidyltransferase family protein n=1 Tax=Echinimonas agarilytica TaxID=1215918 RepID=A0AA41W8X3_9GAMM|nr:nucleotidyltransferase family protein [Echinimonas agarilytica]MCM2681290.1 nucleotidyltransferase family protein [Echinimonas agarilytica]
MIRTAMILAAGRGERMRPLTDHLPKPLLEVNHKPLIVWHIERLARLGIEIIVINHAYLGSKIVEALGDGSQYGVSIHYSAETEGALETAGGIVKALPLLGDEPFLLVNGDVWSDFDFGALQSLELSTLAKLVMIPNPEHNPNGDFVVHNGVLSHKIDGQISFTYSGIGLYSPKLFAQLSVERAPLAPLLYRAMEQQLISAEIYHGQWCDVGTPERLQQLNEQLGAS